LSLTLLNFDSEYLENIYEGCGPATITFIRSKTVQEEMIIEFSLSGSAINNVDYTLSTSSPNSIILPAGQQSISLQINSIYDVLPEGAETIDFELDVLEYGCFITQPTTITFNIYDQPLLDLSMSDNGPQDCPGDELVLTVDANGGIGSLMTSPYPAPPYTYDWVGLGSSSSQLVNPFQSTQYCIEVTDVCQDQELIECIAIEVPDILVIECELVSNDMDVLNLNSDYDEFDVFEGCGSVTIDVSSSITPTDSIFINYNLSGSASLNDDYLISNTTGNQIVLLPGQESISIDLDFLYDLIEEGEEFINLEIEMIEFSCSESIIFQFSLFDQPKLQINLTDDLSVVCPGDEVIFEVEAEGGVGSLMSSPYSIQPYTILWADMDANPLQIVNPSETTEYCVNVLDVCADQQLSDCLIIEIPIYDPLTAESELVYICSDEEVELCVYPDGGQGDYYYEWSNNGDEVCIYDYLGVYTVLVSDACGEHISTLGEIYLDEAPDPVFEFEQIQTENFGVEFQNYTAYMPGLTYTWDFGDGTYSNQEQPIVHYYNSWGEYIVSLGVTTDLASCYKEFSQELLVHPVLYFYAPNVFTPNNDNYNDVFKPSVVGANSYELAIYDRWGRQVFITHDSNASWDGTYKGEALGDGTYVYRVLITKLLDERVYERDGHIILMR